MTTNATSGKKHGVCVGLGGTVVVLLHFMCNGFDMIYEIQILR